MGTDTLYRLLHSAPLLIYILGDVLDSDFYVRRAKTTFRLTIPLHVLD